MAGSRVPTKVRGRTGHSGQGMDGMQLTGKAWGKVWAVCALATALVALLSACAADPDVNGVLRRPLADGASATPATSSPDATTMPPPRPATSGVLRPGDQVEVAVWGYEALSRRVTVAADGSLPHPLLGTLAVADLSPDAAAQVLRQALQAYVRDPAVSLTVAVPAPRRCQVLGEVQRPGEVALTRPDTSLLDVLAASGGLNEQARRRVLLVREHEGSVYLQGLDYAELVGGGFSRQQMAVGDGDMVYVPSARSADAAREAGRLTALLSPLLSVQQATLLMSSFLRALMHGSPVASNTIIVPSK